MLAGEPGTTCSYWLGRDARRRPGRPPRLPQGSAAVPEPHPRHVQCRKRRARSSQRWRTSGCTTATRTSWRVRCLSSAGCALIFAEVKGASGHDRGCILARLPPPCSAPHRKRRGHAQGEADARMGSAQGAELARRPGPSRGRAPAGVAAAENGALGGCKLRATAAPGVRALAQRAYSDRPQRGGRRTPARRDGGRRSTVQRGCSQYTIGMAATPTGSSLRFPRIGMYMLPRNQ